jgi:hypothetical protein
MKKLIMLTIYLVFICSLVDCGLVTGKEDAEKVAKAFFQDRIANGGLGQDKYYSEIFWQYINDQEWNRIKSLVSKALGNIKSYSLNTWNVETKAQTGDLSGTFVVLVYDTEYEKGKGQEELTWHKKLTGGDYKIIGHHINSDEIQKLINKGIDQVIGEGQ